LGDRERFADLDGRTAGECELLAHVAVHRFVTGRSAAEVAAPLERAVADPRLVASIGPDSTWLMMVLGQLFKTDRLDAARRTVAITLAEARRRGSAPGFAGASAWRGWIALRAGAAAEAEADARAAYDAHSGPTWQHLFSACCLIDVLVERGGQVRAAVIDFGGFLGVGNRKVAVDWGALRFAPTGSKYDRITLDLTRDQLKDAPEYKDGKPLVVLGAAESLRPSPAPE
jgi:hypothetical protein